MAITPAQGRILDLTTAISNKTVQLLMMDSTQQMLQTGKGSISELYKQVSTLSPQNAKVPKLIEDAQKTQNVAKVIDERSKKIENEIKKLREHLEQTIKFQSEKNIGNTFNIFA